MLDVPLEVPLSGLQLSGFGEGNNFVMAWIDEPHKSHDGTAFSCRIPSFKNDDQPFPIGYQPLLQPN